MLVGEERSEKRCYRVLTIGVGGYQMSGESDDNKGVEQLPNMTYQTITHIQSSNTHQKPKIIFIWMCA
jgi:hypothetical protein